MSSEITNKPGFFKGGDTMSAQRALDFEKFLENNKDIFIERWFNLIIEAYPSEAAKLMKNEKNEFANPVGNNIFEGIKGIYEGLINKSKENELFKCIDKIIRITAIQDFTPAEAISLIFFLKKVVRAEVKKEYQKEQVPIDSLLDFETEVDEIALMSLNIYLECREKLYEIRVNEFKNTYHKLLERANMVCSQSEKQ